MASPPNFTETARAMLQTLYEKQLVDSSDAFRLSSLAPAGLQDHFLRRAAQVMEKKDWVKINWGTEPALSLAPQGIMTVEEEQAAQKVQGEDANRDSEVTYELREEEKISTARALRLVIEVAQSAEDLTNEQRSQVLSELEALEKVLSAPKQRRNIVVAMVMSLRRWAATLPSRAVNRAVDKFIDELLKHVPELIGMLS